MDFENDLDRTHNKILKNFYNGIIHNVILWIISNESIHGYGIMKKLDEFFDFDDVNCEIKTNSSRVYPILKKMESDGLIDGQWDVNENNKRVKYYSITPKGELLLKHIQNNMKNAMTNNKWLEFVKAMTGLEINYEKRN